MPAREISHGLKEGKEANTDRGSPPFDITYTYDDHRSVAIGVTHL